MYHYIEDDLRWISLGVDAWVLVWEVECYLAKVAEFERLYGS